jgi:hypothetical protein
LAQGLLVFFEAQHNMMLSYLFSWFWRSRSPEVQAALTCLRNYGTPITDEIINNKASTEELYDAARFLQELTLDTASTHGHAAVVKLLTPGIS